MLKGKIIVAGIGPWRQRDILHLQCMMRLPYLDVIVGYKYYFRFVENIIKPGRSV